MTSNRSCSIDGCDKPHKARGYCKAHYEQLRIYGSPTARLNKRGLALQFVETAVAYDGGDCLIWPFAKDGAGYARITLDGVSTTAHRVVCERAHGPAPTPAHQAAHDRNGKPCVSAACVNPAHLRWATPKENTGDKVPHGTSQVGARNPISILTEQQVREIRTLRGVKTQREIGQMYGVARETIRNILCGDAWGKVG